jgi:hypothetical protein
VIALQHVVLKHETATGMAYWGQRASYRKIPRPTYSLNCCRLHPTRAYGSSSPIMVARDPGDSAELLTPNF